MNPLRSNSITCSYGDEEWQKPTRYVTISFQHRSDVALLCQLYITIDPHDQLPAVNILQKCISEVIEWNTINKLVCNPSKTEVIQFSCRFVKSPILSDFLIGNARVSA